MRMINSRMTEFLALKLVPQGTPSMERATMRSAHPGNINVINRGVVFYLA
jgi:hypothetical protein